MQEGMLDFGESHAIITSFSNDKFGNIRVCGADTENPLFCAMDLCRALGYSNGRDAVAKHVDSEDVAKRDTLTKGGTQQLTFVTESGMYALILGSKLPQARQFKHWVTSEVLPSIRKTGSYSVEKLSRKQLALMVIQAEEEKERPFIIRASKAKQFLMFLNTATPKKGCQKKKSSLFTASIRPI